MIAAILAYGYDIANYDIDEARTLLLSAAHAEGRLTAVSAQGLLDHADVRDPQYQLALIDLYLEPVGDGQEQRIILTSYLQRTDGDEPITAIAEPPVGFEPEILAWAKNALGVDTDDPAVDALLEFARRVTAQICTDDRTPGTCPTSGPEDLKLPASATVTGPTLRWPGANRRCASARYPRQARIGNSKPSRGSPLG